MLTRRPRRWRRRSPSSTLPDGVDPAVSALNLNASPVVIAAISSETATLSELGQIASDQIVPELEGIPGVGDVEITGGLEDEVTITLDPVALAQSGIAYPQIQAALGGEQRHDPGGRAPVRGRVDPGHRDRRDRHDR